MLNKNPFLYFSDEVIAKLYPQWKEYCTLNVFESNCRKGHWQLYSTIMSYNAMVPDADTLSWFGDPIDPNIEYVYENYELICPGNYERIGCTIYYKYYKGTSFGQPDREAVAVAFYDC